jgi:hypothetical protein
MKRPVRRRTGTAEESKMIAKSSVFTNIAGAVVAAAAGLAFDAQADFTHRSTVRTESGGSVKYELYGNFSGPTDEVPGVRGANLALSVHAESNSIGDGTGNETNTDGATKDPKR